MLPGMKSTADFATDEQELDWRSGILWLSPRNGAPLYSLTSQMRSEKTTSPEFNWWEEPVDMHVYTLGADVDGVGTTETLTLTGGGTRLKPGDMLKSFATGEHFRVTAVASATSITVDRAVGAPATPAGTVAAIDTPVGGGAADARLLYIGSANREGAGKTVGVSSSPVKKYNYTQIFRDPIEMTRTAMQSSDYRTGDPWKNDKKRAMHKHALGIERAMWYGSRYETTESGQPIRFTGGVTDFIPAAKQYTVTNSGLMDMDEFEDVIESIFEFGSSTKACFAPLSVIMRFNALVRKNTQFQWESGEKLYSMDVQKLVTPAGTLVLIENPTFSSSGYLANDAIILDTDKLRYRYIQDTTYLTNRHDRGTDGQMDEYLTECGLEVQHGECHFWLRGFLGAIADN